MPFRPNPRFTREMEEEPAFKAGLRVKAEAAKAIAESIAPRGTSQHHHYADQFVVVEEEGEVRLGNQDWAAHWVEWGSVNNPPFGVLRRAVMAVGLELREAPKG